MTGPNQPRDAGAGWDGGAVYWRDGLAGVVGEAGGLDGAEYEREPRLPPLPARANASPACSAIVSITSARASAQRNRFDLGVMSGASRVILAGFGVPS
jgi:hypothetical protein